MIDQLGYESWKAVGTEIHTLLHLFLCWRVVGTWFFPDRLKKNSLLGFFP